MTGNTTESQKDSFVIFCPKCQKMVIAGLSLSDSLGTGDIESLLLKGFELKLETRAETQARPCFARIEQCESGTCAKKPRFELVPDSYLIVDNENEYTFPTWVRSRGEKTGESKKWSIVDGFGDTLGKDGEWEAEPIPSQRSDEYLENHRFDSPEEALECFKEFNS